MELEFGRGRSADDAMRPAASQVARRAVGGAGYSRLADGDGGAGAGGVAASAEARRRRAELMERISTKIHAAFWVLAAVLTFYYSKVGPVTMSDSRPVAWLLQLGFACCGVVAAICIYLTIVVPRRVGFDIDWNVYDPRMIPAATAAGVLAILAFLIGYWPVYGLLTPLLLAILFMGTIMASHFVPWCC